MDMQPRGRWWAVDGRLLCFGKRRNLDTLGGEGLPARGPPVCSCRHHGAPRLQGPSRVAERSPERLCFQQEKRLTGPSPILPPQSSEAGPGPWEGARTPTWCRTGS